MNKEQVQALALTDAQKAAVDRIYLAAQRTKKHAKLDAATTQEEVIALLDANVAKFNKKKAKAEPTVKTLVDASELLKVVQDAVDCGVSMDAMMKKIQSMAKNKVNSKADSEIARLQKQIDEWKNKKIN